MWWVWVVAVIAVIAALVVVLQRRGGEGMRGHQPKDSTNEGQVPGGGWTDGGGGGF